jgi:sporulation protein YlmC with PRC-barrel domain
MSDHLRGHGMDAMLDLMDRQIVDHDGHLVGKVDDVELEEREDGRLVVSGLLTGPGALGPRLGGALGSITTAVWSRLSGRPAGSPKRIDISAVAGYGTVVELAISRRAADVDGFEGWVRDRVICALPGAGKEPE